MAEMLNFALVTYEMVPVKVSVRAVGDDGRAAVDEAGRQVYEPRQYDLRDDVPAEVMLRLVARLREVGAAESAAGEDEDELTSFQRSDAYFTSACLDIFRHSYPLFTEEELRRVLTYEQRRDIVLHFFGRRSTRRSPPSDGTASVPPEDEPPTRATMNGTTQRMRTTTATKTTRQTGPSRARRR